MFCHAVSCAGTSFSFLTPSNNPGGDSPDEDTRPRAGVLGLTPKYSDPSINLTASEANDASPWRRHSRGSRDDHTQGGSPSNGRPRSAASGSVSGALVIQPIRSMRDCSHDLRDHRSSGGSQQGSVCGSQASCVQRSSSTHR